jgi:hypothetical protein
MPSSGNNSIGNNEVTGIGAASLIHQITIHSVTPHNKLAVLLRPGTVQILNNNNAAGPASNQQI